MRAKGDNTLAGSSKEGEQVESTKTQAPEMADLLQRETLERLHRNRYDQGKYAHEHRVPHIRDLISSTDLSPSEVPVPASLKKETAHDLIRSVDLPRLISDRLGLFPRDRWIDTLRNINATLVAVLEQRKASENSVEHYDKYLYRLYPAPYSWSAALRQTLKSELAGVITLDEIITLKKIFTCFREEELEILKRQGLADKEEILPGPQFHTDPIGWTLCNGEKKVPIHDQETIKKILREEYKPLASHAPIYPGDRIMIYSPSKQKYVDGALVEQCNWKTWEPTGISYLTRDGGCAHRGPLRDFQKKVVSDGEVQFFRRANMLQDVVLLGRNVESMRDAKVIIWGEIHYDQVNKMLFEKIKRAYLKPMDVELLEQSKSKDKIVKMNREDIVQAKWDSPEFREKFKEVLIQQIQKNNEKESAERAAADQLSKLFQECSTGSHWTNFPHVIEMMHEILRERTEKTSVLDKELQGLYEKYDESSLGRIKSLATELHDRTTQSPEKRFAASVGLTHLFNEQERKALRLDQYPHVVLMSRHPPRLGKVATEYGRKTLGFGSKKKDTTD